MKKSLLFFFAFALSLCCSIGAQAQALVKIAGGGGIKTSVYSQMVADIAGTCSTGDVSYQEQTTKGGTENYELLRTNKVPFAILPTDLLFMNKMQNASAVANIKAVATLHPETVHLIVRGDAKTEGGFTIAGHTFGGSDIVYKQAEDLKGRPVGAVGGSLVTARILGDLLHEGWNVQAFNSTDELLSALQNHKVDAVIISAGQPSPAVASIHGNFKLLPIRGNADTAAVYAPIKVQYDNLNGNQAVDSLSAQAVLATRKWYSDAQVERVRQLHDCLEKNLGALKDKDGSSPAWQSVDAINNGKWPMYEFPQQAVAQAAAPAVVKHGKR